MNSPKYNRTPHLPWSPGGTSDDKIAKDVSSLLRRKVIITEKIDGSNCSLEADGCFARTHAGPPTHASFDQLKALHASIKHNIPEKYQLFGEWCYALHSIPYDKLPSYFLMFGVRELYSPEGEWQEWEVVKMWAKEIGVATVPELWSGFIHDEKELQRLTEDIAKQPSRFGKVREGVVIRVADSFLDGDFSKYVMKWVRPNHVQTSDHWKNQEIVRNQLCVHGYNDKCGGGFECYSCGMPNPNC